MDGAIAQAEADPAGLEGWYVAAHGAAQRGRALEQMWRLGVPCLSPERIERQRVKGPTRRRGLAASFAEPARERWIERAVPLLPGYVFVRPGRLERLRAVLEASAIDGVLRGASPEAMEVPPGVMEWVYALHGTRRTDAAASSAFRPGEAVLIEQGLLAWFHGVVKSADGDDRIIVEVDAMGRFVEVSLPCETVAKKQ